MNMQDEVTASINPGDDFYNYVNKKWRDNNPVPADKSRYSAFTELHDTVTEQLHELLEKPADKNESKNIRLAKELYVSGVDEESVEKRGLEPARPFLREIEEAKDIEAIKAIVVKRHSNGRPLLWRLGLDVDEKNSERYVMTIGQSGLMLPDRDYYFEKGEQFETTRVAYKKFLAQFFGLLDKDNIDTRVNNVYAIEEKLAEASNTSIENRDVDAMYNPYTFDELSEQFLDFDWAAYQHETGLEHLDGLIIHQPKFLAEAIRQLKTQSVDAWRDYLIAHSVVPLMPYLAKEYDTVHFAFFGTVLSGAEQREDRYKRIIDSVSSLLPEPIGQLYVDAHFDASAKEAITDLVDHIQDALRDRIKNLDWMSEETKRKGLEKLDTFMPLLGYPDKWQSYELLTLQQDYVGSLLEIRKFDWEYDVARVMEPVDRQEWLMSPAMVNAYYWPNTNGITFPAAILQPPMFDSKGDFAANYGGIGVVIGHEITHGFDDKGSKYDKIGNLNSWWSDDDRKAFDKRAESLAVQYDQYEVDGQHVKGSLTLGENIADLGGMLIAYDAFRHKLEESGETDTIDGFTPEQRFFMSEARVWRTNIRPELALQFLVSDPHSPAHLRVNGAVTNLDAWYEAWDIADSAKLYQQPDKRIRIW